MHIAGGLYHELCDVPKWNAQFGSGGRAAAAISSLSPGSTLHTYTRDPDGTGATQLRALGIQLCFSISSVSIAFAYFHPLSRPHIEPRPSSIVTQEPIFVSAEVALRFGFLEGTAVVDANYAIYDPQTARDPEQFSANGSKANHRAFVMNENELCRYAQSDGIGDAAAKIFAQEKDTVIIVKRGIRGVTVFVSGKAPMNIPAYRSERVFKIGTGDVFTAVFAHYWAEVGLAPEIAADLSSRTVAAYCETMSLPIDADLRNNREPIGGKRIDQVIVRGTPRTIGRRFTLEEACSRLTELGVGVCAPDLYAADRSSSAAECSSLLVLADGLSELEIQDLCASHDVQARIVLDEEARFSTGHFRTASARTLSDFASAIYSACWPMERIS